MKYLIIVLMCYFQLLLVYEIVAYVKITLWLPIKAPYYLTYFPTVTVILPVNYLPLKVRDSSGPVNSI